MFHATVIKRESYFKTSFHATAKHSLNTS